jgi:hypothetical protein
MRTELLGYVQVQVGSRLFALPVQAVHAWSAGADGTYEPTVFEEGGELGIRVDGDLPPEGLNAQIEKASAKAVRELSKRHLN